MYRLQINRRASMSKLTFDGKSAASNEAAQRGEADTLRVAALAVLSIRFIQGFVYWGGGSRRFIYAPAKLDPNAANWMANKFQSAMPGAMLGTDHIIAFLLHYFYLLYAFPRTTHSKRKSGEVTGHARLDRADWRRNYPYSSVRTAIFTPVPVQTDNRSRPRTQTLNGL